MERPRPSTIACVGLVVAAGAYDIVCPEGETISERLDPILERPLGRAFLYPLLGGITLHLLNLIPQPQKYDPLARISNHLNTYKGARHE